ncbi:hypothetical protein CAOG_07142 [Capsaspora owczarzaki ATCC 30864]|uniref:hypothetical protein n=1 Tax=Capsaspora owczarzaki (strain ATCC 30864) TaxID=595528 RepID=UPI0001FE3CC0|nr:hypothetical protein CAOG_07142 [Capsaspora owczarzaki ATCC 30864]|eukprot:XP_004343866.1 hypothetical protein CAOG_07142 [Capsaspora owczarzaki ATCC 30864]
MSRGPLQELSSNVLNAEPAPNVELVRKVDEFYVEELVRAFQTNPDLFHSANQWLALNINSERLPEYSAEQVELYERICRYLNEAIRGVANGDQTGTAVTGALERRASGPATWDGRDTPNEDNRCFVFLTAEIERWTDNETWGGSFRAGNWFKYPSADVAGRWKYRCTSADGLCGIVVYTGPPAVPWTRPCTLERLFTLLGMTLFVAVVVLALTHSVLAGTWDSSACKYTTTAGTSFTVSAFHRDQPWSIPGVSSTGGPDGYNYLYNFCPGLGTQIGTCRSTDLVCQQSTSGSTYVIGTNFMSTTDGTNSNTVEFKTTDASPRCTRVIFNCDPNTRGEPVAAATEQKPADLGCLATYTMAFTHACFCPGTTCSYGPSGSSSATPSVTATAVASETAAPQPSPPAPCTCTLESYLIVATASVGLTLVVVIVTHYALRAFKRSRQVQPQYMLLQNQLH